MKVRPVAPSTKIPSPSATVMVVSADRHPVGNCTLSEPSGDLTAPSEPIVSDAYEQKVPRSSHSLPRRYVPPSNTQEAAFASCRQTRNGKQQAPPQSGPLVTQAPSIHLSQPGPQRELSDLGKMRHPPAPPLAVGTQMTVLHSGSGVGVNRQNGVGLG